MLHRLIDTIRHIWEPIPPPPAPPPPLDPNNVIPKDELRARMLRAQNEQAFPHTTRDLERIRTARGPHWPSGGYP